MVSDLLLICEEADFRAANALAESTLSTWPQRTRPRLHRLTPHDVAELDGDHHTFDIGWAYFGREADRTTVYETLDVLEDWRLPSLLTRVNEQLPAGTALRDGITIGPPNLAGDAMRMLLMTLGGVGGTIRQLKTELQITKRQQSGLARQIAQLDEELRLAARMQRQLMPDALPEVPGMSFEVLFRPAGYVSGDIYDVQVVDDEHVVFYVADAVGHGVPAALLTMFIKHALMPRDLEMDWYRVLSPDLALGKLNREMIDRQTATVQFATACYGVLNTHTRQLRLSRAGHPAPLLLRSSGAIEPLEPEGPLLGVFDSEGFELMRTQLDPGDRLLMYSDGFELAFGDAGKVDASAYMPALHALRQGTPAQAIDQLNRKLDEQAGSLHQRDDLTALMLDMLPNAA